MLTATDYQRVTVSSDKWPKMSIRINYNALKKILPQFRQARKNPFHTLFSLTHFLFLITANGPSIFLVFQAWATVTILCWCWKA